MCHHVHIPLSAEERTAVRRLTRLLVPVYAAVMLAIVGLVALNVAPRSGELVAQAGAPAASR